MESTPSRKDHKAEEPSDPEQGDDEAYDQDDPQQDGSDVGDAMDAKNPIASPNRAHWGIP